VTDLDRLGRASGVAFVLVSLGAILSATLVSPTFTWTGSALSDLGAPGTATALPFNGGLVLSGLVALPFVAWLYRDGRNRLERAGGAVLGVSAVLSALVGIFPIGTPQHFPVAVAFFLSIPVALWTHATGSYRAGDARGAAVGLVCGALDPAAWLVWWIYVRGLAPGLAIPEIVGVLGLHAWALYTVLSARRSGSANGREDRTGDTDDCERATPDGRDQ
jgi:hypothetical membrane protein